MWRAHYLLTGWRSSASACCLCHSSTGPLSTLQRRVPSATAGSAIALLAVAQCVRPDYWQYLTEVLLGFAVTLTAIFTRPTLAQCDWQLLTMGVAVMILATISDELASRGASAARRGVLFSPQRDGPREWIWSALGVPPGRVLVVDLVERRLTIAGQPAWVYLFVATLSFSRRLYVKASRYQHQTTWLDGLENAFFTLVACCAKGGSSIPAPSSSVTREPKRPTPISGCAPSRRIGASRLGRARSVVVPIAL
jgi:hypothetical protein